LHHELNPHLVTQSDQKGRTWGRLALLLGFGGLAQRMKAACLRRAPLQLLNLPHARVFPRTADTASA
jgi:hypothetical protein